MPLLSFEAFLLKTTNWLARKISAHQSAPVTRWRDGCRSPRR